MSRVSNNSNCFVRQKRPFVDPAADVGNGVSEVTREGGLLNLVWREKTDHATSYSD